MIKRKKIFEDTIKWYDNYAEGYVKITWSKAPLDLIDDFLALLPQHPKIIDIGCGPGRDTELFHKKNARVVGIDASKVMISEARRINPGLTFIEGNFLDLPFEDNSFDGLWAHNSILHLAEINDVRKALREFWRVLKPNGILYIQVKKLTGTKKIGYFNDPLLKEQRFIRFFTKNGLESLVKQSGFKIIKISYYDDPFERQNTKKIYLFAQKI